MRARGRAAEEIGAGASGLAAGFTALWPILATAVGFGFFVNLLLLVSPLYMLQIYDRVLASRNETTLAGITVVALFALLIHAVLEMLRAGLLMRGGLAFDAEVAEPVFDAVHRGSLRNPDGGHATALRDLDVMRDFLSGGGLLAFCDAPWTPIFLVACFVLHPWFGWMAVAGGALILVLTVLNELVTKRDLMSAGSAGNTAQHYAQTALRNGEVLHAMGMLGALRRRWAVQRAQVHKAQGRAGDRGGLIVAATKFARMLLQTLILGVGAYLAIHREISPGSMIAASIIIGRALAPIELMVANWKAVTAVRASHGRLAALLAREAPGVRRMSLPRPAGRIEAQTLVVCAPGRRPPILRGVSFRIAPGMVVGVVGPSAAGKSTLARALTGIWPAEAGSLRIDGADYAHWDPQALGRHIGYLPQDVELFSGTVAENIARFETIDEAAVIAVAKAAGCHDLIQGLADGYDTQIGVGGHALSGGQRQRIALARAMYGEPSFVVLDEPNANLDPAGEEALMRAIESMRQAGTSVVIITHKVHVLSVVDAVLVLNGGAVQAYGPREQVLGQVVGPRAVPSQPSAAAQAPALRAAG